MNAQNHRVAKSEMLIRKPVSKVFEALANPEITSKFWFTEGSARLEAGKTVEWTWGQFGVQAIITVTEVKRNELIQFQWPSGEKESDFRTVEISFESKSDQTTFVHVVERGFDKDEENLIEQVAGQTEGWALVLSALKAWLEHGINLNLISDHKPE
ncbi:MAG TPA: SRPBCC family protein [Balneolaceae bacterium]